MLSIKLFRACTTLQNKSYKRDASTKCKEIRIPLPWGHIAGKWWGPQHKRPILALHGWQDNCGTFDLLIPKLPQHLGYLAIDLPGHGYSSWLPSGTFYNEVKDVMTVRYLQKYMGWNKVTFLGHSLGAIIASSFGILYPGEVDFMINLDGIYPLIVFPAGPTSIDDFLRYNGQNIKDSPCNTMEEIATRLHYASNKSIDLNKVPLILKRNTRVASKNIDRDDLNFTPDNLDATNGTKTIQNGIWSVQNIIKPENKNGIKTVPIDELCIKDNREKKFYLARDPRLKLYKLLTFTGSYMFENSRNIKFPLLYVSHNEELYKEKIECYSEIIATLKETNREFQIEKVKGLHHDHLNDPDKIAMLITDFIMKYDKL